MNRRGKMKVISLTGNTISIKPETDFEYTFFQEWEARAYLSDMVPTYEADFTGEDLIVIIGQREKTDAERKEESYEPLAE
jgi:hypothetical protein